MTRRRYRAAVRNQLTLQQLENRSLATAKHRRSLDLLRLFASEILNQVRWDQSSYLASAPCNSVTLPCVTLSVNSFHASDSSVARKPARRSSSGCRARGSAAHSACSCALTIIVSLLRTTAGSHVSWHVDIGMYAGRESTPVTRFNALERWLSLSVSFARGAELCVEQRRLIQELSKNLHT
jgi:hypothetical protein